MELSYKLSKYHRSVILLYFILTPILIVIFRPDLNYNFRLEHIKLVVPIIIFILIFLFFRGIDKNKIKFVKIVLIVFYAVIFAIPEEIIFRGVIQNYLQSYFYNIIPAIIFSSLIFGAAHLLNAARSIKLKDWNYRLCGLTTLAGIPLSFAFATTGSLLIPTVLHAIFIISLHISKQNPRD
jgi:membrane protease YdiL (CAAX protease family)